MEKMQKIKNIEFLRCILMFGIVLLHIFSTHKWSFGKLYPDISMYHLLKDCFCHGNIGVEGFFIISGFFLVLTFKNTTNIIDFIKKKYIRLSPVILFSTILCLIGLCLHTMHFKLIPNVLTIFLLNNFGWCWCAGSNPVLWYTSALFFGLLVYFCILKYFPVKYKSLLFSLLIIISYSLALYFQGGRFFKPCTNYYIFNAGVLRALGGIGVGCLIGDFYKSYIKQIQNVSLAFWQKLIITILEILILLFVVFWIMIPHQQINPMIFVVLFSFLLILFVSQKGFLAKFTNNDFWVFLGKYQYSLYCLHFVITKILGIGLWTVYPEFVHKYPSLPIFITLFMSIIMSIFTYHFIEEPCAKYLTNKFLPRKV